ncbi:hypothetical protein ACFVOR_28335 [Streptomyces sp. NPDC057837]|uniref:hypothetical protein n=1 Tax=Streptomyces sp. NPDC057837 TaxID=3346260 RepID=UPI0036A38C76
MPEQGQASHGGARGRPAFVVRRFADRGVPVDLSVNPAGTLTAADRDPLRHEPSQAVDVALRVTAPIDAVVADHPEADRKQLRTAEKGQASPHATVWNSGMNLQVAESMARDLGVLVGRVSGGE